MNRRVSPLRAVLLALLTILILAIFTLAALYLRDSTVMREADIAYNSGEYGAALAGYQVLQEIYPFKQEAFQKSDYCNYNLAREAMENENWEMAISYLNEIKAFELDSVNRLITECEEEIKAEEDRLKSFDKFFLEDLEKAITLRLDPDDDGDIISRELMFLKKYEQAYFQDQKLREYALRYLDALREQERARYEVYESEKHLAANDGELLNAEILVDLYNDYDFMADNVQFVGEYVGAYEGMKTYNEALHEVYADMHSQIDRVAVWPATNDYGGTYYHLYRNNTPYHVSIQFRYLRYTGNEGTYLGESTFLIENIPPYSDYKVLMSENDFELGVTFYLDWIVTGITID